MAEISDRIPGEIIFASYANQIRDRAVMRYVDGTARNASVPLPTAGDLSYLTGAGILSIFDGSAWVDFIDVRGGQTIVGELELGSLNFTAPAGNLAVGGVTALSLLDSGEVQVVSPLFQIGSDILGSDMVWNLGDETAASDSALRFRNSTAPNVRGQFMFDNQARFHLDVDEVWLSVSTTSLTNQLRYDSTITGNFTGQINGGTFRRVLFASTSTEKDKDVSDKAMSKAHGNHPIHLLKVPFVRWSYKPGVLVEGDPREGADWFGPTAEGMASVYEFGADPDGAGGWGNINDKVLTEGLLWHVQELTKRVEELEARS